jgi:hypothetical protein
MGPWIDHDLALVCAAPKGLECGGSLRQADRVGHHAAGRYMTRIQGVDAGLELADIIYDRKMDVGLRARPVSGWK